MQKIETLFERDGKYVIDRINPEAAWILEEDHWRIALETWKWDGTACLVKDGFLYRRHRVKQGKARPPGWFHWSLNASMESGHGWAPIGDGTADQYHREAYERDGAGLVDGTYELVGPMIQDNPYGLSNHQLWPHGVPVGEKIPLTYDSIEVFLRNWPAEGLVWWAARGMVKVKRRDFGIPWPVHFPKPVTLHDCEDRRATGR